MKTDGLLIRIGDFEWFIHQSVVIWMVLGVILCTVLFFVGKKFKNADPTKAPKGVVLVFEQLVNLLAGVLSGNLNKKTWRYLPYLGTIMMMMAVSNLLGLIGLQLPTSNLSLDITLVLMMIVLIHGTDIKTHGLKGKFKAWCEPVPALLPLNIIGDIAFPMSLTLRLFGNMLGGTIIITLLYLMIKSLWPFSFILYGATPFLHMYFDIFTAFMQTYIFFMLASFFLGESCDAEESEK